MTPRITDAKFCDQHAKDVNTDALLLRRKLIPDFHILLIPKIKFFLLYVYQFCDDGIKK